MQAADTVTWMEHVRATGSEERVRFFTGVIVGERTGPKGREFRIAIEFISGNLPKKVELMMWVSEMTLLIGRTTSSRHVGKVTPQALINRKHGNALRTALQNLRSENARLRLALNRAGVRL